MQAHLKERGISKPTNQVQQQQQQQQQCVAVDKSDKLRQSVFKEIYHPLMLLECKRRWTSDDFRRISYISKGQFGNICMYLKMVWKMREVTSDKVVAVKQISKEDVIKQNMYVNLKREIEIHSHLMHKHIVECYGYFTSETKIFIVLEYAQKGSLCDLIKNQPPSFLSESQIAKVITILTNYINENLLMDRSYTKWLLHSTTFLIAEFCIGNILKYMNYITEPFLKQYIYLFTLTPIQQQQDVKLENILIDLNGDVKLGDFGCSVIDFQDEGRTTFCGTVDYLSPEILSVKKQGTDADIWALGVVFYELLYKIPPFEGADKLQKMNNIYEKNWSFKDDLRTISVEAKDLITQMLNPDEVSRIKAKDICSSDFILSNYDPNVCIV